MRRRQGRKVLRRRCVFRLPPSDSPVALADSRNVALTVDKYKEIIVSGNKTMRPTQV